MHRYLISVCFFSPTTYYATDNVLGKHSDHFSKFILIFFFFLVTICIPYTSYMQMMSIASAFISEITLCKCCGFLKTFPIQYGWMNKKSRLQWNIIWMRICVFIPQKLHIDYMCTSQDNFLWLHAIFVNYHDITYLYSIICVCFPM